VNAYRDTGFLSIYAGTSLDTAERVVTSVLEELRKLKEERLDATELRRSKDHLKGATLLALEGTGQRMNSLARYHLYFNRYFTPDELIAMLESVTPEDVQEVAREFFQSSHLAASVVGNLDGFQLTRDQLAL
jgi:predicted Zn-dependent peptidase